MYYLVWVSVANGILIAVSVKMVRLLYHYATCNGFRLQWFFNWLSALGFRILMVTVSVKRVGWQQCILFA